MRPTLAVLAVALVLVGCGGGGENEPERAALLLTFEHEYGGVAGGMAQLRVEPNGSGSLKGGPYGNGCGTDGELEVRLSAGELDRLSELLDSASDITPRVREEPATESPSFRVTAGDLELSYAGYDVVPEAAEPLFDELDRLVNNHCLRVTP